VPPWLTLVGICALSTADLVFETPSSGGTASKQLGDNVSDPHKNESDSRRCTVSSTIVSGGLVEPQHGVSSPPQGHAQAHCPSSYFRASWARHSFAMRRAHPYGATTGAHGTKSIRHCECGARRPCCCPPCSACLRHSTWLTCLTLRCSTWLTWTMPWRTCSPCHNSWPTC